MWDFVTTTPLSRVCSLMRWLNRVNGVLLLLAGLLGFFSAVTAGLNIFESALLSMYVGMFGALLLRYEFDTGMELRHDFGFMYSHFGRAAFLLLAGNLSWTCAPVGVLTAIATNAVRRRDEPATPAVR